MKLNIILLTILILANYAFVLGQVSKPNYDRAVDYLNCRAVELSLSEQEDKKNYERYKGNYSCDKGFSLKATTQFLEEIKDNQLTIGLSSEIDSLKKQFRDGWKPEDAVIFLTEEVFKPESKFPKLIQFEKNRRGNAAFEEFKVDLKKNLLAIAELHTTEDDLSNSNKANASDKEKKENTKKESSETSLSVIFPILSIVAVILVITIAIIGYILIKNTLESLQAQITGLQKKGGGSSNINNPGNDATKEYVKAKIADLKYETDSEIRGIKVRLFSLENKTGVKDDQPGNTKVLDTKESGDTSISGEIFYLSYPNDAGNFNKGGVHNTYREGVTIYKFRTIAADTAEFKIDERPPSISLALQYPDKSIEPVCEPQNHFDSNAERIITIRNGTVRLKGDQWEVIEKAKIRYER